MATILKKGFDLLNRPLTNRVSYSRMRSRSQRDSSIKAQLSSRGQFPSKALAGSMPHPDGVG
jgi:hypothetical protein